MLVKAEKDLSIVTDQYMARLVNELQGSDFWKLRRAYSPAVSIFYPLNTLVSHIPIGSGAAYTWLLLSQVQEYVEAASLCKFCKSGTVLTLSEINKTLLYLSDKFVEPLQINILDYLLGVIAVPFVCIQFICY